MKRIVPIAMVILLLGTGLVFWYDGPNTDPPQVDEAAIINWLETLDSSGFERVVYPGSFDFPADHGPHNAYPMEWWYLMGVLKDETGRRLGIQLMLARLGLDPEPPESPSRWAASAIYSGLFSLSDPSGGGLLTHQRIAREALSLSGATGEPMRVWVENWRVEQLDNGPEGMDMTVHIAAADLALDLELHNRQPVIDSNDLFESDQAATPPFLLYAQPRLRATGRLRLGEQLASIEGELAMEHAWGELPLPGGPVASDRFSLRFDDGRQLLCFRTHRVDQSGTPATNCLLIDNDGHPAILSGDQIALTPAEYWTSEPTGTRYPVGWKLRLSGRNIDVTLLPDWQNQEGRIWGVPFWAGPVRLESSSGEAVGEGFMQLNGYKSL